MLKRLGSHHRATRLLKARLLQLVLNTLATQTSTPIHPQLTLVTTGMEGPCCKRGEPQDGRPAHTPMGDQHPARLTKTLISNA